MAIDHRDQKIADNMRKQRRLAGLSQEEMGRRLGVTLRSYARWERGETAGHVGRVDAIAKALKCKPEDLMPEPEEDRIESLAREIDALGEMVGGLTREVHDLRTQLANPTPRRSKKPPPTQ